MQMEIHLLPEMQSGQGNPSTGDRVLVPVEKPTVTGILNRLEEKGYIAGGANPADGRYRIIEVTEKGNQVMEGYGRGSQKSGRTNLRLYDGRGAGKASGASGPDPGDYDGK